MNADFGTVQTNICQNKVLCAQLVYCMSVYRRFDSTPVTVSGGSVGPAGLAYSTSTDNLYAMGGYANCMQLEGQVGSLTRMQHVLCSPCMPSLCVHGWSKLLVGKPHDISTSIVLQRSKLACSCACCSNIHFVCLLLSCFAMLQPCLNAQALQLCLAL